MSLNTIHTELSDEELLHRYRGDEDNQWLGYLLQRYTALLFGVAVKYLKDRTQSEDAVQQVFLKVLTSIPRENINNFKGWLYILMRNHCLQQLRDKMYHADETLLSGVAAIEADKDEIKWQQHTLEQMNEAIEMLNDEQRAAVTLFYLKKYSYEQIMSETGFTFMQVKSHIQNGKRNLRAILIKKQVDR